VRGDSVKWPVNVDRPTFDLLARSGQAHLLTLLAGDAFKVLGQYAEGKRSFEELVDWWFFVRFGVFPPEARESKWRKKLGAASETRYLSSGPDAGRIRVGLDQRNEDLLADVLERIEDAEDGGMALSMPSINELLNRLRAARSSDE